MAKPVHLRRLAAEAIEARRDTPSTLADSNEQ
jgi:hypothetical protein